MHLKGVDLTIKRGETHCLAGENGCGKSTIIKVISGFYKPDAGSIEVDGKALSDHDTCRGYQGRNPGYLPGFFNLPESDSN